MSEWQDISTAPRDGLILLTNGDRVRTGYYSDQKYHKKPSPYFEICGMNSVILSRQFSPTHWMPLPKPPAHKQEG